jgi:hypothetical protein
MPDLIDHKRLRYECKQLWDYLAGRNLTNAEVKLLLQTMLDTIEWTMAKDEDKMRVTMNGD